MATSIMEIFIFSTDFISKVCEYFKNVYDNEYFAM